MVDTAVLKGDAHDGAQRGCECENMLRSNEIAQDARRVLKVFALVDEEHLP